MHPQQHQLFTLNTLIAAGLMEIKRLKYLTVQTEQYELTAQLREMERLCQSIESDIACGIYPSVADQVIISGNENYFDLLFKYGYLQKWKNISGNFDVALALRKKLLNAAFNLGEDQKKKLSHLNDMMKKLEAKVNGFYNDLKEKAGNDLIINDETVLVVLKCYARNESYKYLYIEPRGKKPFYEFSITYSQWVGPPNSSDGTGLLNSPKVRERNFYIEAMALENNACFIFSFLAMEGYLAWEDLRNIENVELEVRVACSFAAQ